MKTFKLALLIAFTTVPAHGMLSLASKTLKNAPLTTVFVRNYYTPGEAIAYANLPIKYWSVRETMLQLCFGENTFNRKEFQQLTNQTELISRDYLLMFAHDTRTEAKKLNSPVTFAIAQSTLEKNKELYEAGIAGEKKRKELLIRGLVESILIGHKAVPISGDAWTNNDDLKYKNYTLQQCLDKLSAI